MHSFEQFPIYEVLSLTNIERTIESNISGSFFLNYYTRYQESCRLEHDIQLPAAGNNRYHNLYLLRTTQSDSLHIFTSMANNEVVTQYPISLYGTGFSNRIIPRFVRMIHPVSRGLRMLRPKNELDMTR